MLQQSIRRGFIALSFFCLPALAGSNSTSVPGIENFHQINQNVYRGAQPTAEGIRYLSTLGVKLVIDLREPGSRSVAEERSVTGSGMQYVNVPMSGLIPPTTEQMNKILALLEDPAAGPVFVHCKRGADRTGAVIAAYRIDHDKWDNVQALQEAMGDHMSHFQIPRRQYIRNFHGQTVNTQPAEDAAATAAAGAKN